MRRIRPAYYIITALLLFSIGLNVKYEVSTHKIFNKLSKVTKDTSQDSVSMQNEIEARYGIPPQQYWTERSWMNCVRKLGIQTDVVFYGDSHTYGSDFRQYFPDVSTCNLGCSGDNLDGFIRRVEMIKVVHPKKIFFMGGGK